MYPFKILFYFTPANNQQSDSNNSGETQMSSLLIKH